MLKLRLSSGVDPFPHLYLLNKLLYYCKECQSGGRFQTFSPYSALQLALMRILVHLLSVLEGADSHIWVIKS